MNNLALHGLWEQFVTFYFKIFSSLPIKVRTALRHYIKRRAMKKVVQNRFKKESVKQTNLFDTLSKERFVRGKLDLGACQVI